MKLPPIQAAQAFIASHAPNCNTALLAGSAARGEHKDHSDLDIVIIDDGLSDAYRESLFEFGWRIEAFFHTNESVRRFFQSDCERGRPTMPHMCAAGIVLRDDGSAVLLKQDARALLEKGPEPLTQEAIQSSRYFLNGFAG